MRCETFRTFIRADYHHHWMLRHYSDCGGCQLWLAIVLHRDEVAFGLGAGD